MKHFSIFDTKSTSKEEIKRRHLLLLVNAVILSWMVWCILNLPYYRQLHGEPLFREIIVDMVEHMIEIVVLVELSLVYSKIIIRVFWNQRWTFARPFIQVIVLTLLNVLSSLVIGVVYQAVYPDNDGLFLRVFATDFTVVTVLSTTYFISFLLSRHHAEESNALQSKLDNLALQTNNHFMFNCFSTLGGMIRTAPDDAEKFLQSLSHIYRYLVQNSEKHVISLMEELHFSEEYITLVNYRYTGIDVVIDKALKKTNAYVAPVSVQQLVENAVKHNGHGSNLFLHISIYKQADTLVVENNIVPLKDGYLQTTEFGLNNLRKRIRLVSGKELVIQNDGTMFRVQLPLIYEEELKDESLDY